MNAYVYFDNNRICRNPVFCFATIVQSQNYTSSPLKLLKATLVSCFTNKITHLIEYRWLQW